MNAKICRRCHLIPEQFLIASSILNQGLNSFRLKLLLDVKSTAWAHSTDLIGEALESFLTCSDLPQRPSCDLTSPRIADWQWS